MSLAQVRSEANTADRASGSEATVVGVLHKWTNYSRGWRSRCFLPQNGVLSYSKIRRPPVWVWLADPIRLSFPELRMSSLHSAATTKSSTRISVSEVRKSVSGSPLDRSLNKSSLSNVSVSKQETVRKPAVKLALSTSSSSSRRATSSLDK
ncbi:hypothetical protein EV1_028352 [Malus domestica]